MTTPAREDSAEPRADLTCDPWVLAEGEEVRVAFRRDVIPDLPTFELMNEKGAVLSSAVGIAKGTEFVASLVIPTGAPPGLYRVLAVSPGEGEIDEVDILVVEAVELERIGPFERGIEQYRLAVEAQSRGADREAATLMREAAASYERAEAIESAAETYRSAGMLLASVGEADMAIEAANRAVDLFTALGDREAVSDCLIAVGKVAEEQRERHLLNWVFKQTQEFMGSKRFDLVAFECMNVLGRVARSLGDRELENEYSWGLVEAGLQAKTAITQDEMLRLLRDEVRMRELQAATEQQELPASAGEYSLVVEIAGGPDPSESVIGAVPSLGTDWPHLEVNQLARVVSIAVLSSLHSYVSERPSEGFEVELKVGRRGPFDFVRVEAPEVAAAPGPLGEWLVAEGEGGATFLRSAVEEMGGSVSSIGGSGKAGIELRLPVGAIGGFRR